MGGKDTKIKLLGIGNVGNFNYYTFEKKQGLLNLFCNVLTYLGLEFELYNMDEKSVRTKKRVKNLVDMHEVIDNMHAEKTRADIIYGKDKVFLMIHCPEKLREKFNNELGKMTIIPKAKKFKLGLK